ncbi:hypothetical protein FRC07_006862, partial [Ceratobasidium sp. 392]
MSHRAAANVRMAETDLIYFWDDNRYCIVHGTPEDSGDLVIGFPKTWPEWQTLSECKLDHVDAILWQGSYLGRWYFFFQGFSYMSVYIDGDRMGGYSDLNSGGPYQLDFGKRKKLHADGVSGAFPVPGAEKEVWIFGGTQMARISFKDNSKLEVLSDPYYIAEYWSNLGWDSIDMIFPVPRTDDQAYVFTGNKAARVIVHSKGNVQLVGSVQPVG